MYSGRGKYEGECQPAQDEEQVENILKDIQFTEKKRIAHPHTPMWLQKLHVWNQFFREVFSDLPLFNITVYF